MWAKNKHHIQDFLAILYVVGTFLLVFHKALFAKLPVSRLDMVSGFDSFFNPNLKAVQMALGFDPSGILIFYPLGHYLTGLWSQFKLPVWNPLSACGYPLLGDPQAFVFSPLNWLGAFNSPFNYSVSLVLELLSGSIGAFLLARSIGTSRFAALFVAIAYGLCPYLLAEVDLSGFTGIVPFVLWGFVRLAKDWSLPRSGLCSALVALAAYVAHPEVALFAAVYGGLLYLLLVSFAATKTSSSTSSSSPSSSSSSSSSSSLSSSLGSFISGLIHGLGNLSLVAGFSICFAAPLLFPFIEFMQLAGLYKESEQAAVGLSPQFLFNNLGMAPGSAPIFLGGPLALLILPGLVKRSAETNALSVAFFIALILTCQAGPFADWLGKPPLSYVATIYGVPELLLFACLISALSLDTFVAPKPGSPSKLMWILLGLSLLSLLSGPALTVLSFDRHGLPFNFFDELWRIKPQLNTISFAALATSILLVTASFLGRVKPLKYREFSLAVIGTAVLLINTGGVLIHCRGALPNHEKFDLPVLAATAELAAKHVRTAACGRNFFLPNQNLNYGINDFRCFSPLLLRRYVELLKACGARQHNLYFYDLPDTCSPLLGYAGVDLLLTRTALSESIDLILNPKNSDEGREHLVPIKLRSVGRGLRLLENVTVFDKVNRQFDGRLKFKVQGLASGRYVLQFMVNDKSGKNIWSGPSEPLYSDPREGRIHRLDFHVPVPLVDSTVHADSTNSGVSLHLCALDSWTGKSVLFSIYGKSLLLGEVSLPRALSGLGSDHGSSRAYRLLREFTDGTRLYANAKSLGRAYLASKAVSVSGPEEALQRLSSLEGESRICFVEGALPERAKDESPQGKPLLVVDEPGFMVFETSESAAFFVLNESFYPGWTCQIDGRAEPIFRANCLFQAVKLPPGARHRVVFRFEPQAFYAGIMVLGLSLIVLFLACSGRLPVYSSMSLRSETRSICSSLSRFGTNIG